MEETKVYLIVQDVPSSTKTLARVFSSPEKAQEVIDRLRYVIRSTKDHYVAVADYYVAVGAKVDALDYEWVWVGPMLDGCKPIYTRKGYILNLPHPVPRP